MFESGVSTASRELRRRTNQSHTLVCSHAFGSKHKLTYRHNTSTQVVVFEDIKMMRKKENEMESWKG